MSAFGFYLNALFLFTPQTINRIRNSGPQRLNTDCNQGYYNGNTTRRHKQCPSYIYPVCKILQPFINTPIRKRCCNGYCYSHENNKNL
jgi:hypothetical protein